MAVGAPQEPRRIVFHVTRIAYLDCLKKLGGNCLGDVK